MKFGRKDSALIRAARRGSRRRSVASALRLVLAVSLAAWLVANPGAAFAVSQQVPYGARAIAMGGAFSSLADDATALFWNPAGLARVGHEEVMFTHANLFNSGINDNVGAFV